MSETVLITGASRGLGLALARAFLRRGDRVFAGWRGVGEELRELARRSAAVTVCTLDVTDIESVRQAAAFVAAQSPALDILINNAAIYPPDSRTRLEELEFTHFQSVMDVNAFGPLRVTQQFLPLLERGKRRLILNISSEAGSIADCWRDREYAYCMSKAALNIQSRLLQNYLGPRGFHVLAVHPGWMRTDMGGPNADIHPDEAAEGILKLTARPWSADEPIYVDYRGNPLRW